MRWILLLVFAALIAIPLWPDDETDRAARIARTPGSNRRDSTPATEPTRGSDAAAKTTPRTRVVRPGPGLDVTVVDEDDKPHRGVPVLLRLRTPDGPKLIAEAITDERGFVSFEDQNTPALMVCLDPGGAFEPVVAGRWEPDAGYRSLRLTLWEPRELVLHVWWDGKPGFTEGLVLHDPVLSGEQRDPINGIVRGQFIPQSVLGDDILVSVSAPQCMAATSRIRLSSQIRHCEARIDLRSAVDLTIRILGRPETADRVGLVKMLEHQPRFQAIGSESWGFEESQTETRYFLRVAAGRYRVTLGKQYSRRPLHEFGIPSGTRSHEVTVDLRGVR